MRWYLIAICLALANLATVPSAGPAIAADADQKALVFFSPESANVGERAKRVLLGVARQARTAPGMSIRVIGFTAMDAEGQRTSRELAQARANQVADVLIEAGVTAQRITIETQVSSSMRQGRTEARRVEVLLRR